VSHRAPYEYRSTDELSPFGPAPDTSEIPHLDPERLEALERDDRQLLWKPFTQMQLYEQSPPLIVEEARGMWLRDIRGTPFLDGVSSLWCNLHGHRRAEIDSAVLDQLAKVAHSTLLGPSNVPAVELARELVAVAPSKKLTRVFYSDSGSTAVEIAVKMAFQFWQQRGQPGDAERTVFLCLENAYHGDTIGAVSVGGIDLFHSLDRPLLFSTGKASSPYCYRCPLGKSYPGCEIACLGALEQVFEQHEGKVAALILEPLVQGAAGLLVYPHEYLSGAVEIARRHGALVIADEVATGFGRTGTMFAVQRAGVEPDLMACAKGLSAGYLPLAATLATEEIYEAFKGEPTQYRTFFHGHTYTGNPLACAAGVANLRLFRELCVLDWVERKVGHWLPRLEALKQLPHVGDVRQLGLMAGIELVRDRDTREGFDPALQVGNRVCRCARERGVLIRPLGDVVVLMPPLNTSTDELDLLCGVTHECIAEITERAAEGTLDG